MFYLCSGGLSSSRSPSSLCSPSSSADCALPARCRCLLLPPLPPSSPRELLSPSPLAEREPSLWCERLSLLAQTTPLPSRPALCERWCLCSPLASRLWLRSLLPSLARVPSVSLMRLWCMWWREAPVSPFSWASLEVRSRLRWWCLRGGWDWGGSMARGSGFTCGLGSSGVPASTLKSLGLSQSHRGSTTSGRSRWVVMSGRRCWVEVKRGLSSSWYRASLLARMCLRICVVRCSHTDIIFSERRCSWLEKRGINGRRGSFPIRAFQLTKIWDQR